MVDILCSELDLNGLELCTALSGRIGRVHTACAEGREFESWSSQTNDLHNLYLLLPSLTLNITRIGQELVSSVSGQCE